MNETPFSVFFGSSTESKGFMEEVASWIEPLPNTRLVLWNTPQAFPAGRYTLDRLLELTRICHAAVFVFGEDDKVWYREGEHPQPRDNVLLEYGLFASRLGIRNTLICRVARSQIASDLSGITTINFQSGRTLEGKRRVEHWFSEVCGEAASTAIHPKYAPVAAPLPVEERPAGFVSRDDLRKSDRRFSGEVFAIELLARPVTIERNTSGHVMVTVDRHEVRDMLISNEGRIAATRRYVTSGNRSRLQELDREVQDFLATGSPDKRTINLLEENICLRWASGGILSIVKDANGKRWVPLFFRDIRPYGWNIALGTSERWFTDDGRLDEGHSLENDLNQPWWYILREFLEESLIVAGTPREGGSLSMKNFNFGHAALPIPIHRAVQFDDEHCRLRQEKDGLTIVQEGIRVVKLCDTKCSINVLSRSGGRPFDTHDVLVCFSLLDLGIEVVKVVEYDLGRGEWMLDGEIKEHYSSEKGTTEKELVRMPMALMSLDYLGKTFGKDQDWQRYTFGPQPSIEVAKAPDEKCGEIQLYSWDVKRRMEAIDGRWDAGPMRSRFLDWYDKWGRNFGGDWEDPENPWKMSAANPSCLFVPGTAKILNLYFRLNKQETR